MAVHLLAILANEVRDGQVANITFHTGVGSVIVPIQLR
jgi:hypothetical protein